VLLAPVPDFSAVLEDMGIQIAVMITSRMGEKTKNL
jgi:hypothetical protein